MKSPQHNFNELGNQLITLEQLNVMHEKWILRKLILSAYLFMSSDYRSQLLKYLGFPSNNDATFGKICPKVWLRSSKIPVNGEGLANKEFEDADCSFAHMTRVHCPKVMRTRNVKQFDPSELITKEIYFKLRHTIEVAFFFLKKCGHFKRWSFDK